MSKEATEERQPVAKYIYILVVLIGVIVLALTYIVYTYFNSANDKVSIDKIAGVDINEDKPNITKDTAFQTPIVEDSFGIDENDSNIISPSKVKGTSTQNTVSSAKLETTKPADSSGISYAKTWKANDYKFGDIKIGKYTVIYGDTLWELSEGAYGSGSKWVKIANVNTIDYFANGRPLIHIGQVLTIPE